ncbi:MAG TPA: PQQ-binding-like beta-propeller repeat protein [Actinomycetota bacterium]
MRSRTARPPLALVVVALLAGVPAVGAQEPACAPLEGHDDRCEAWGDVFDEFGPGGFATHYQRPVIVAGADTVFSTGAYVDPLTGIDPIVTIAYDPATGARRWVARYEGPEEGGEAFPYDSTLAPDGGTLYVAGSHTTAAPDRRTNPVVVAFDAADGSIRWIASFDASPGRFRAVAVSPDGRSVLAAGSTLVSNRDLLVAEIDAETGAIGWSDALSGPADEGDEALDLAVSSDGERLVVTGERDYHADYDLRFERGDIVTIGYDLRRGARDWVAVHDGPLGLRDYPAAVAVSPDGARAFVAATQDSDSYAGAGTDDIAVLAYDAATGGDIWTRTFDGSASDNAESLAVSPGGDLVYVQGTMTAREVQIPDRDVPLDQVVVVTALGSADGATGWSSVFDAPGRLTDIGRGLVVDPGGDRVYATAISGPVWAAGGVGSETVWDLPVDAATVAYDAHDGAQLWTGRYNGGTGGSAPTRSSGIAISPDGSRVFVLAAVNHPVFNPASERRNAAYGTIAYDA